MKLRKIKSVENKLQIKRLGYIKTAFWGCPIPIIYREDGEILTVEENQLPVKLPDIQNFGEKSTSLSDIPQWKETVCAKTGMKAIGKQILLILLDLRGITLGIIILDLTNPAKSVDSQPVDQYTGDRTRYFTFGIF